MKYWINIARHAQVLEACHGAKPPTIRLDIGCIPHELLTGIGIRTKVFLNTLCKKKRWILLNVFPICIVWSAKKLSCHHGNMPTQVLFTLNWQNKNNIGIQMKYHVDADKYTTEVFHDNMICMTPSSWCKCYSIAFYITKLLHAVICINKYNKYFIIMNIYGNYKFLLQLLTYKYFKYNFINFINFTNHKIH